MAPRFLQLAKQTWFEWKADQAQEYGAAVAYFALFSMAPLLLIGIAIAGLILDPDVVERQIIAEVAAAFGPGAADTLRGVMDASQGGRGGWVGLVVGIVAVLVGATGVLVHLKRAMNHMWEVPPGPKAGITKLLRERGLALAMVLVIGFLLLLSLLASALLSLLAQRIDAWMVPDRWLLQAGEALLSFGMVTVLFAILFRVLPDVHVYWRDVWTGAAVTALLFTIGKEAIGLYLGNSSVSSTYGAAGSLIAILVWVYFSAMIFFLGAEFTQVHAKLGGRAIRPDF